MLTLGFPNDSAVTKIACSAWDAGDAGSIPGSGRFPGGGHGNPLQYSCLENPMDRGVWQETVHWVAQGRTRLEWLSTHVEWRKEQSIYRFTTQFLPWVLEGMVVPVRWGILEASQVKEEEVSMRCLWPSHRTWSVVSCVSESKLEREDR